MKPGMMYRSGFLAVDWMVNHRMRVVDLRMLKWMSLVTRENKIRNEKKKKLRGSIRNKV